MNTKGPKFVQTHTIENRRSAPQAPTTHEFSDVPRGLPINCYTSHFLNSLTDTQKLLLNTQPPIDLDTLLEMTHKVCK